MTAKQFGKALRLAKSDMDAGVHDIEPFWGFGLPGFERIVVTIEQVAALIRWQAFMFNGSMDQDAIREIRKIGRRKFEIVE
jgi:hypothetical protein